jgi:hypothetical protein
MSHFTNKLCVLACPIGNLNAMYNEEYLILVYTAVVFSDGGVYPPFWRQV